MWRILSFYVFVYDVLILMFSYVLVSSDDRLRNEHMQILWSTDVICGIQNSWCIPSRSVPRGFVNSFFCRSRPGYSLYSSKQWVGSLQAHLSFFWLQARLFWHTAWERCSELVSPSAHLLLQAGSIQWVVAWGTQSEPTSTWVPSSPSWVRSISGY